MPTAAEHYHAGHLANALAAAIDAVRSAPSDRAKRWLLAELLLFSGDTERADKHLDVLNSPEAPDPLAVTLYRQLLRAEASRREVFGQGRLPEFIGLPPEHVKLSLEALIHIRENRPAEAAALLTKAEALRPNIAGTVDDVAFTGMRDLDDVTAGVLEVMTSTGNYYWVPLETVELIEFREPERPRDLLFRRTHLIVTDGPDGEVYIPTLYPATHTAVDEAVKLGRQTTYSDAVPIRGAGLREFLIGDDVKNIMDFQTLEFTK